MRINEYYIFIKLNYIPWVNHFLREFFTSSKFFFQKVVDIFYTDHMNESPNNIKLFFILSFFLFIYERFKIINLYVTS